MDLDVPRQSEESVLNVDGGFGRGLHELDPILNGKLLPPLFGHLLT